MPLAPFGFALHGGAGFDPQHDYTPQIEQLRTVTAQARTQLQEGAAAIDVASQAIIAMERCGLYIAGRGASANAEGDYELDACLMDGARGTAGAVAALQGFKSPIQVARALMDHSPHVLLVSQGAARFAREKGLEPIDEPSSWFTPALTGESFACADAGGHGTVGCVVLDQHGHLAAATSTGGLLHKYPGRVGDTPLVGASTWADTQVAVSCTGHGEAFIRRAAAVQVAHRLRFGHGTLEEAVAAVLADVQSANGAGGLIAMTRQGEIRASYNAYGMKHAYLLPDGSIHAAAR